MNKKEDIRILVVDDEEEICRILSEFLNEQGFTVTVANSGEDALKLIDQEKPRLVFLDMHMPPGISGLDVLRQLQGEVRVPKIIMVTGVEDEEQAREALLLGAADYIQKPFYFDYIQRVIDSNLRP